MTAQSTNLDALRASSLRLRTIVGPLDDDAIRQPAYPADWSIAQVMSHLGSGAVIFQQRVEAELSGDTVSDDLAPKVWDEWNAKSARAQADDGLAADSAFIASLDRLTDQQRAELEISMGPMTFDFETLVGMRLNEHALHSWDVEVASDPAATIPSESAALVVDNLGLVARYTAKATPGEPRSIVAGTTDPVRSFTIALTGEGATLESSAEDVVGADLTLPSEAFVRLIYGRLDPDHTPPFEGDLELLDRLRATYPGP